MSDLGGVHGIVKLFPCDDGFLTVRGETVLEVVLEAAPSCNGLTEECLGLLLGTTALLEIENLVFVERGVVGDLQLELIDEKFLCHFARDSGSISIILSQWEPSRAARLVVFTIVLPYLAMVASFTSAAFLSHWWPCMSLLSGFSEMSVAELG
jgi:hypothetical protein